jgi:putative membrane protein
MSTIQKFFSSDDLDRIQAAVREAEQKSSGEIVPYFVERSDNYEEALWRAAGFSVLIALFSFFFVDRFTDLWFPVGVGELSLVTMLAGSLTAALTHLIGPLKRFFAGRDLIDRRVQQRATEAFVSEEVFKTRERTGIMIFLSLFEHEVVVLGDSGINAKVQKQEWDTIVDLVVKGIKSGNPTQGLIHGIRACGDLLERKGVERRSDDRDELSDRMRIGGEKP